MYGCFHATAAKLSSCDRNYAASKTFYYLAFYRESWSALALNHFDILLSDDSLVIKEAKKLATERRTAVPFSDSCWQPTDCHSHTHLPRAYSLLRGVEFQHFILGEP